MLDKATAIQHTIEANNLDSNAKLDAEFRRGCLMFLLSMQTFSSKMTENQREQFNSIPSGFLIGGYLDNQ